MTRQFAPWTYAQLHLAAMHQCDVISLCELDEDKIAYTLAQLVLATINDLLPDDMRVWPIDEAETKPA